nr:hypothetical protein [Nonomuraea basaltis]
MAMMQVCQPVVKLAAPWRSVKVWVKVSRVRSGPSGWSSQRRWSSPQVWAKTWGGSFAVMRPSGPKL